MGILDDGQEEVEALVRTLGYEPAGNYLLMFHRMSTGAKLMTNLLFRVPSMGTRAVEKRYLVIFTPKALVIHRMKKDGETQVVPMAEVQNFRFRDGANHSVVVDFEYNGEAFSFYTYKDFSWRMKYVAENLKQLLASNFMGYAKE